ncbi:tellurium resistance TerZ family protein [Nocardia vinacea]|uniref:Tellurium resistance TerZ family protein n=1 Tax=Nocardia vinacea TaxID=96468 RepID=A0ABZ1YT78_9NOCA|nr:TerD family protein [Nocardia vinacea]
MSVTLRDDSGAGLDYVRMALGWDPVRPRRWFGRPHKDIDLNAAALLFTEDRIIDVVYHEQLSSADGSVRHFGDSTTGRGKGDNEIITVDLTRLPSPITTVIFIVTCYSGQTFEQIDNAFCRVVDAVSGTEITRYDLRGGGSHTGLVMGKLVHTDAVWRFHTIGAAIHAQHPVEAISQLGAFVQT